MVFFLVFFFVLYFGMSIRDHSLSFLFFLSVAFEFHALVFLSVNVHMYFIRLCVCIQMVRKMKRASCLSKLTFLKKRIVFHFNSENSLEARGNFQ